MIQEISVEELKARKNQGENLHILDVREPAEYAEVNMGALLIPLGQIVSMQFDAIENWKDEEVIVHCRSGARSASACAIMQQAGFTNVKNLKGGIIAWQTLNA